MNQMGLFAQNTLSAPLAYRVRPKTLEDFQGQGQVLDFINKMEPTSLPHLIFWGPPGCGKTTLANILAQEFGFDFYPFNAVMSGVADLKKLIEQIKDKREQFQKKSLLFIDEIHRFNKAQQDALLPHLERGDFLLVGATTESPRTALNKAIISRVRCLALKSLKDIEIENILLRAAQKESRELPVEVKTKIASFTNGDAREALNCLQTLIESHKDLSTVSDEQLKDAIGNNRQYDKNANRHYDVISAFIKSMRGSDPDATALWLAVMLDGGEDPMFIARRIVIQASEDVGNANPQALIVATSAMQAIKEIGMPEARIILSQAAIYIASSPKSNAAYLAINKAMSFVEENPTVEVPTHLRNHHPDKSNYLYPHNHPNHYVFQKYMPATNRFYEPTEQGSETKLKQHLNSLKG